MTLHSVSLLRTWSSVSDTLNPSIRAWPTRICPSLPTEKVRNAKPSYFQNVALKVNVKLSGINQIIKGDLMPDFVKKGTIIFGAE